MSHHVFRSIVLAAALAAGASSHAAVDLDAKIPTAPEVRIGKLANGLTYYIQRNGKPAQRLELRLIVKAGSVLEDDDQPGLAHFTEHLAFNGSTHFRKTELISWLQSIGVKWGPELNAFTSYDDTVYILPVPTARKADVDKAFDILEDWAHGLALSDDAIEKERPIVIEEARTHQGVGQRVWDVLLPKVFAGTRRAARDVVGKEDKLRSFKPEALRRFYRDWYRPDLMAIVAVGDVDPADAERQIAARFGDLRNPGHERVRTWDALSPPGGTEAVVVADKELTNDDVTLYFPVQAAPAPDSYRYWRTVTIQRMVGIMLNQRLAELAQAPVPPFRGASGGIDKPAPGQMRYVASVALGAGGSGPGIAALLQEHKRVRAQGFSAAELDFARKLLRSELDQLYNERGTLDSSVYVDGYLNHFRTGEPIPGIEALYRVGLEFLSGIGLDEVNAAARRLVPGESDKLVVYAGRPASAPTGAGLLADVVGAERAPVAPRVEPRLAARLMTPPAHPGRIVEETGDAALGVTRLTLSNGVKVILKPTDFDQDQVLLTAERYGGLSLFVEDDLANARYAASVAGVMGAGGFTPVELARVLAGRNASIGLSLATYADQIDGSAGASADNIETMLQLLWLRMAGVRRDEDLYRSFISKERDGVRNRLASPEARFGDAIMDTLYAGRPLAHHAVTPAELDKVDLDRSLAIYRARFASARGFTFVLAGRFDVAAIKPLLAAYLGTLPTPELALAWKDDGVRYATGVVKKEVDAGSADRSQVSLDFTGPADWSPDAQLRIRALAEVMTLRINDVLREKLGLIYSGSMGASLARLPYGNYWIGTTLPTAPDKVDRMVAALFGEIERLKRDGPSAEELQKVKQNWQETYRRNLRDNDYWLRQLEGADFNGTDPHRILHRAAEYEALTAADIRQAAQRYLNTENYVQVVQNPESAALAKAGGPTQ